MKDNQTYTEGVNRVYKAIEDLLYENRYKDFEELKELKQWEIDFGSWDGSDCSLIGLIGVYMQFLLDTCPDPSYEKDYYLETIGRLIHKLEDIIKRG